MANEHDPHLVMLIKVLAISYWRGDLLGLCHSHDSTLMDVFHNLEAEGVLVRDRDVKDYIYHVTEPYKQYCWYHG
jgi:hypothetical protein